MASNLRNGIKWENNLSEKRFRVKYDFECDVNSGKIWIQVRVIIKRELPSSEKLFHVRLHCWVWINGYKWVMTSSERRFQVRDGFKSGWIWVGDDINWEITSSDRKIVALSERFLQVGRHFNQMYFIKSHENYSVTAATLVSLSYLKT